MSSDQEIIAAHFDCQFGAAGDMLVAALIDAGVNQESWLAEINKIALSSGAFQVDFHAVMRCGIKARKMDVLIFDEHQHQYNPTFPHLQSGEHRHGRHLAEIINLIEASGISQDAKDLAIRIFQRMARAESKIHGIEPAEVHFHELGAIDAIVDIVGFAIAFDLAKIQQVSCSALPLGSGVVKSEHGIIPVPAPAVLELLREVGAPSSDFSIPFECLTPTGAAILCQITKHWGTFPAFLQITGCGYGSGTKNPEKWPNASRAVLGKLSRKEAESSFQNEIISVVEANIDDQTPQSLAFAVERFYEAGALDVIIVPALMKKGRSGHLLKVLCHVTAERFMQELVIQETSSIGARAFRVDRLVANRSWVSAQMDNGSTVRIKVSKSNCGSIVNAQPEYDDLSVYARKESVSIKEAHNRAMIAYYKLDKNTNGGEGNGGH